MRYMLALAYANGVWAVVCSDTSGAVLRTPVHVREGRVYSMPEMLPVLQRVSREAAQNEPEAPVAGPSADPGPTTTAAQPADDDAEEPAYTPSAALLGLEASFDQLRKQVDDFKRFLMREKIDQQCKEMQAQVLAADHPVFRMFSYGRRDEQWLDTPAVAYSSSMREDDEFRLMLELAAKAPSMMAEHRDSNSASATAGGAGGAPSMQVMPDDIYQRVVDREGEVLQPEQTDGDTQQMSNVQRADS